MATNQMIVLKAAHALARRSPVPVCEGCPDGRWETNVVSWLQELVKTLDTPVLRWGARFVGGKAYVFQVKNQEQEWMVALESPHPAGGKTLAIPELEAEDELPKLVERDRIQELLDGQAELHKKFAEFESQQRLRDVNLSERFTRIIMLLGYACTAPWVGHISRRLPGLKPLEVVMNRLMPNVDPKSDVRGQAYPTGVPSDPQRDPR
jgi:hypothetical protein